MALKIQPQHLLNCKICESLCPVNGHFTKIVFVLYPNYSFYSLCLLLQFRSLIQTKMVISRPRNFAELWRPRRCIHGWFSDEYMANGAHGLVLAYVMTNATNIWMLCFFGILEYLVILVDNVSTAVSKIRFG